MTLAVVPVTFRRAHAFIDTHHRHHRPPQGMRFVLGVTDGHRLVGVATVGRPVARHLDNGVTAEVTRACTDGTPNANSMLYAACWRAARAMGYQRLLTYSRPRTSDTGGIGRTRWEIHTHHAPPADAATRAPTGNQNPNQPRAAA